MSRRGADSPDTANDQGAGTHDRRSFLGRVVGTLAAATGVSAGWAGFAAGASTADGAHAGLPLLESGIQGVERRRRAYSLRMKAARWQASQLLPEHRSNGDDERYENKIASFTKSLPHNRRGEVDIKAYKGLIRALRTGDPARFDRIRLGGVTPLTNPQGGLSFTMEGPDPSQVTIGPAPAFASAREAAEVAENYWMALARDVPFIEYKRNSLIQRAAAELSRLAASPAPKHSDEITASTIFRIGVPGAMDGPFISQFLLKPAPFGAEQVNRQLRTAVPGVDYMTAYEEWLAAQNGFATARQRFDRTRRYIRNGRDLSEWVHADVLFQAYFDALLILIDLGAPFDPGNPYNDHAIYRGRIAGRYARNQIGFATLGGPYIASIVCAVAKPALTAVWFQKWFVHRRLRPEEFGGRIHNHMAGKATYPIDRSILNSRVVDETFRRFGTYLLPQAYPEGAPTHPAYGAGHATVAGACVTVLKAFFDESFILPDPVEASASGEGLGSYEGFYTERELTVGGELNKLATNIAIGRNFAGIHWRSDAVDSLKLGEEVAIRFLRDERRTFHEQFGGFSLTRFDGTKVTI
jgi:hypothetical protein